ncbi:unnamed protein product [Cuscuta campestris]|uniref:Uncharacterized protein n=1 Tax=Cuscuta campestris TaxID=132261 RepID=A0A484LM06_9ASTE|nr:unnamed protein product [Cuscuta campestris]
MRSSDSPIHTNRRSSDRICRDEIDLEAHIPQPFNPFNPQLPTQICDCRKKNDFLRSKIWNAIASRRAR